MRCSLWLYSPNVTGKELLAICRGGACACLCAPLLCSSPTRRDLPAGPATPAWLLADAALLPLLLLMARRRGLTQLLES